MRTNLLIVVVVLAALSTPTRTQAQSTDDSFVDVRLMFGLGGGVDREFEGPSVSVADEPDLELTFGAGGAYMVRLHDHFALGGLLALQSWQSEAGDNADQDRNWMFDLSAVPQGIYGVAPNLDIYLSIPMGLTLDILGEEIEGTIQIPFQSVTWERSSLALGFNVGFLLGARFGLGGVGLLAELGYVAHIFSHGAEASTSGVVQTTYEADWNFDLGQFALNLGVFF